MSMAKQIMTFEGKNIDDWFKLPFVFGIMKDSNMRPFIALGDNPHGKMKFINIGDECVYVDGYITDEAYKGNHFVRKELSNRFKSLFKALGLEGTKYSKKNDTMVWHYDWWGDGSGSILLIREELSGEFEKWAKEYNK